MELVEAMSKQPGICLVCGGNPPDPIDSRRQMPAIDLDVDVNWGDNAYLCNECASLVSDLIGRPKVDVYMKVKKKVEELREENEALTAENEQLNSRLHRIVEGAKARKEQLKAVN
jgi:hypothetical protein